MGIGKTLTKQVVKKASKKLTKSDAIAETAEKAVSSDTRQNRVAKAEDLQNRMVGSLDTTGATYHGYQI